MVSKKPNLLLKSQENALIVERIESISRNAREGTFKVITVPCLKIILVSDLRNRILNGVSRDCVKDIQKSPLDCAPT